MAAYVTVGPWGGDGGHPWSYVFQGGLKEIFIDHGSGYIKSLYFKDEIDQLSQKFGARDANGSYEEISLEGHLIGINGTYGEHSGMRRIIKSLTFVTDERTYGPYPTEANPNRTQANEDRLFTLPLKSGRVVGFLGRAGGAIDAIGIYAVP